ncbi:hypothetical protein THAOC_16486 [Thalassiosira oceanica]|uniref:Uncharacterized protein n=1 Tax=Thalassiosira oceanica TaxID=159749 RepID=K0SD60_THAOC|nr:hypothetical protein THAOC_16486 [Thalassiosira oceanica]|eukprot:EJK62884.1 hypothetical protein THAOC_16486 [Thalassiosira oceanica]
MERSGKNGREHSLEGGACRSDVCGLKSIQHPVQGTTIHVPDILVSVSLSPIEKTSVSWFTEVRQGKTKVRRGKTKVRRG